MTALIGIAVVCGGLACAAVLAILHSVLADEARGWLPHIANRLVRAAAQRMPEADRERYEEEWLAELAMWRDRPVSAIVRAASIRAHARSMRASLDHKDVSFADTAALAVKHALDRLASFAAICALSPLIAGCGLAIALTSQGPIFYRQARIGRQLRPVAILRFRIMPSTSTGAPGDQLTPVGYLLWRTCLNCVPSLWNVARGQLSLVGPRPMTDAELLRDPDMAREITTVKPGLTGPSQLSSPDTTYQQRVQMDLEYVQNRSLRLDLAILCRTVTTVVRALRTSATP